LADKGKQTLVAVGIGVTGLFVLGAVVFLSFRVDVPTDRMLIVTNLSGEELRLGEFVALKPEQQGVQLEPKNEGIYWINPYLQSTEVVDATIINSGEVGVLIRQFGKDLPGNQNVATPDYGMEAGAPAIYKGVLRKTLKPGKHLINSVAYRVERYPAFVVPPGFVGVSVDLAGPLATKDGINAYVTNQAGTQGVSPKPHPPGTYYINPYCEQIVMVEKRTQRFDFTRTAKKDGSIDFQSRDAFTLNIEGTIEWSVDPLRAPEVLCRLGSVGNLRWPWEFPGRRQPKPRAGHPRSLPRMVMSLRSIQENILVPYTRSYVRLMGAVYTARSYIDGKSRMKIQEDFKDELTKKCKSFGILIRNIAIRKISPPSLIKQIINDRGLQKEQRAKIKQNIEKIKSDASLARNQELIRQGQLKVETETRAKKDLIMAEQDRNVRVKAVESELAVASIGLKKASVEKETYVIREQAKIDVNYNREKAEVDALRQEILAAGGGLNYIRGIYVKKFGGGLKGVLTSDTGEFMDLFRRVMKAENRMPRPVKKKRVSRLPGAAAKPNAPALASNAKKGAIR